MLVLNLPFKALMFLTLMRPSLVLFLVLWLRSEERRVGKACSVDRPRQQTAYEVGLGIPAEPLFRSLVAPCLNCLEAVKKPPPVAFKVMCLLPITILEAWVMLLLNLPFKGLMFLTLMRPSLDLFLVLWITQIKDILKLP